MWLGSLNYNKIGDAARCEGVKTLTRTVTDTIDGAGRGLLCPLALMCLCTHSHQGAAHRAPP